MLKKSDPILVKSIQEMYAAFLELTTGQLSAKLKNYVDGATDAGTCIRKAKKSTTAS